MTDPREPDQRDADDILAEEGDAVFREEIEEGIEAAADFDIVDLMSAVELGGGVLTELDAAMMFAARAQGRLLFAHGIGWFRWTNIYWRPDDTRLAFHAIARLAQSLSADQAVTPSLRRGARRASFAKGVEDFAEADPRVAVTAERLDQDADLLGTPGGTYDLRTGKPVATDAHHLITKQTLVTPEAKTPWRWYRFLLEMTGGDRELIRWLQSWFGYSATGHTREEKLAFFYGTGGNGKGTLIKTVETVLGDYAAVASMHVFLERGGTQHTTDIAMLRGARMVTAQETNEDEKWNEARLKTLTGGDKISARFMRRDNFTFTPQFTLTMSGNHPPKLDNVDEAIRRRLNVVPFNRRPKLTDPHLKRRLQEDEGGAILGWIMRGAVSWYRHGMPERPGSVTSATGKYFDEQDDIVSWINDECSIGDRLKDTLKNLHMNFTEHTGSKISQNKFSRTLVDKLGYQRSRPDKITFIHGLSAARQHDPWRESSYSRARQE